MIKNGFHFQNKKADVIKHPLSHSKNILRFLKYSTQVTARSVLR